MAHHWRLVNRPQLKLCPPEQSAHAQLGRPTTRDVDSLRPKNQAPIISAPANDNCDKHKGDHEWSAEEISFCRLSPPLELAAEGRRGALVSTGAKSGQRHRSPPVWSTNKLLPFVFLSMKQIAIDSAALRQTLQRWRAERRRNNYDFHTLAQLEPS